MKATGIVRKVDELGRVVLPKELRDCFGIEEKTPLEIFTEGESIVLKKYSPGCVFCGSMDNVSDVWDKHVCSDCLDKIRRLK